MEKDLNLSKEEKKIILLICGDAKVGKKTIVKNWLKNRKFTKIDKGNYLVFQFFYEIEKNSIPIEIRILNSEEIDTDLKINSNFFKNSFGGFVIVNIEDESSFSNGEKWKEKIDLMCCLPNKFPLPIFLIINKCDKINFNEIEQNFQKENSIEQYSLENQFFNRFYVQNGENLIKNKEKKEKINETIQPFVDMINVIFSFKDIKEKFIKSENENDVNLADKKKKNCILF